MKFPTKSNPDTWVFGFSLYWDEDRNFIVLEDRRGPFLRRDSFTLDELLPLLEAEINRREEG